MSYPLGKKWTEEQRERLRESRRRNHPRGMLGKTHSEKTKEKTRRAFTRELREKMSVIASRNHAAGKYPRTNTKLHKALKIYLRSLGIETKSEVPFGRYCVDEYDEQNHIAYEADGEYWHSLPGAKERDEKRENYLKREFGLEVVHFTERDFYV